MSVRTLDVFFFLFFFFWTPSTCWVFLTWQGLFFQSAKDTLIYQREELSIAAITETFTLSLQSLIWLILSQKQSELVSADLPFLFYIYIYLVSRPMLSLIGFNFSLQFHYFLQPLSLGCSLFFDSLLFFRLSLDLSVFSEFNLILIVL